MAETDAALGNPHPKPAVTLYPVFRMTLTNGHGKCTLLVAAHDGREAGEIALATQGSSGQTTMGMSARNVANLHSSVPGVIMAFAEPPVEPTPEG